MQSGTLVMGFAVAIMISPAVSAQEYEKLGGIEGAVLYDYDQQTSVGDKIFGTVISDLENDQPGRCSHGSPIALEYPNGDLVAFYANTSGHNLDGWSEYAVSRDKGKTWSRYKKLAYSYEAYQENPRQPVWAEDGLVTPGGTVVLFLTQFDGEAGRTKNMVMTSTDSGETWSAARLFAGDFVGYPSSVAVSADTSYVLFDAVEEGNAPGPHVLFSSTDDGETWERRSVLPLRKEVWYGALTLMKDGSLLAGAYDSDDEKHLYYSISRDGGRTWSNEEKSSELDKSVRDPELAYLNDKYYLMGRSSGREGPTGRQFVLYQSDDGIHWGEGVLVNTNTLHPDGYSSTCIINRYGPKGPRELMVVYSIGYNEEKDTNEYVFFIRPNGR